jgi:hypothetical protein
MRTRVLLDINEVRSVRSAMRAAGVVGPEMARPASDLPEIVRWDLDRFVEAGLIREGPAGTYYLNEAQASAVIRLQILKAVVFWFIVVIIPVIVLELTNSLPATR